MNIQKKIRSLFKFSGWENHFTRNYFLIRSLIENKKTNETELGTRNTELGTQNTERRTRNAEHATRNAKHVTRNEER